MKTLVKYMKQDEIVASRGVMRTQPPSPRFELLQVDFNLDGLATYLSWSRRITGDLVGRGLDGYLKKERSC